MRIITLGILTALASCIDSTDDVELAPQALTANHVGVLGDSSCKYSTVAAAVAAASSGDTILVEEGRTIDETIGVIAKDLTIRAGTIGCGGASSSTASHAVIDAQHLGRVAKTTADVTFRQVDLVNGSREYPRDGGLDFNGPGLWVAGGTTRMIDANVMGAVLDASFSDFTPYGAGIEVGPGAVLHLSGNSIVMANTNWGVGAAGILVAPDATAWLEDHASVGGLLLFGNYGKSAAGGVMAQGTVKMQDDATIAFNASDLAGGGLYMYGGTATTADRTAISYNTAPIGAGIFVADGMVLADNVLIDSNIASGSGGGIYAQAGYTAVSGSTVTNNRAGGSGGGIYAKTSTASDIGVFVYQATVEHNTAGASGGGVAAVSGHVQINGDTSVSHNSATSDGGGVYLSGADVAATIDTVTISDNHAARGGGLLALAGVAATTQEVIVSSNRATGDGGGVYLDGAATSWNDVFGSSISDNTATRGAGVFVNGGTVEAYGLALRRNAATDEGGGFRLGVGATTHLDHGTVRANTTGTRGGGFLVAGGALELVAVDVISNTAATDGGGIALANTAQVTATDTWFLTNSAEGRGGGIAVLSFAENTNPQLTISGDYRDDSCAWRGTIGANEYCSEIQGNTASAGGGGVYLEDGTSTVTRTAIRSNTSPTMASAVWMANATTGSPSLIASNVLVVTNGNTTAVDSVRVDGGVFAGEAITSSNNIGAPFRFSAGSSPALLQHSIVWDAMNLVSSAATPLGASCTMFRAVTGATVGSNRAFGLDPQFVTTPRGYYRLGAISVNAIDQCTIGLPVDLDNDPRPINTLYDRGAFERQ